MKSPFLGTLLGCIVAVCQVSAQEKLGPEFGTLKEQFDAKVKTEVQQPYDVGVVDLNIKYVAALERALGAAQQGGKLEDAVAIKNEREAVSLGKGVPVTDDASTTPVMKQLRGTYHDALGRLETERAKRMQPLQAAFAKALDVVITNLTKGGKLEEAMAVKKQRDELASNNPASAPAPASIGLPPRPGSPTVGATKEAPFANSLGMKFVPVPATKILMCIHETRKQDYAAYAEANPGVDESWKTAKHSGVSVSDADDHPVVSVSYEDAVAFCEWLGKKEGKVYRLPTDREWSIAVGIGAKEPSKATPESLAGKLKDVYPWGDKWPPLEGSGNYADTSTKEKMPGTTIPGYTDGFPTTAPVMKFSPNKLGIYDLSGNVWEWCEDWFNEAKKERVLRGGAWDFAGENNQLLLSSYRLHYAPDFRRDINGFRTVVVMP